MIKAFLFPALAAFVLIVAASFTGPGALMALIFAMPFRIGGLEGLQLLWVVALMAGVPFFGYVFALLFPGKDGRLSAVLSITGFWVGLLSGAVLAMTFQGTQ